MYRNLQRLVGEGRLSLAPVQDDGGRSARFDPETRAHDRFVCQRCKRIQDVPREGRGTVDLTALEIQGFRVTSHALAVYGVCPRCGGGSRRGAAR